MIDEHPLANLRKDKDQMQYINVKDRDLLKQVLVDCNYFNEYKFDQASLLRDRQKILRNQASMNSISESNYKS